MMLYLSCVLNTVQTWSLTTQLESTAQGNMESLSGSKEQSEIKQLLLNDLRAAVEAGRRQAWEKEIC